MSLKSKLFSRQFVSKGIKFAMIGALGTVLNLSILYVLTDYGHIYYILSELIAIIVVFVFNYVGNILVGNIKIDADSKGSTG